MLSAYSTNGYAIAISLNSLCAFLFARFSVRVDLINRFSCFFSFLLWFCFALFLLHRWMWNNYLRELKKRAAKLHLCVSVYLNKPKIIYRIRFDINRFTIKKIIPWDRCCCTNRAIFFFGKHNKIADSRHLAA